MPALGGAHLAALLTDANTASTINSVLVVNYPTAVVLTPVTTTRGGGGGGIGSSSNYTNSPTHSPSSQVVVPTSSTTSKNYDNYIFIGAGVLGGIMLLGMGGGGLYYLKKRKEHMVKMQLKQQGLTIVIKPPVLSFERPNSAFSIRQNVVVPSNNNDDDENEVIKPTSRVDDEGAVPAGVDEYNLWGDLDIEAVSPSPNSKSDTFTPVYSDPATPSLDTKKPVPNSKDLQSALSKMFGQVNFFV